MTLRRGAAVLFCCTRNAVRSPMAEALAKHRFGTRYYFDSAGLIEGDLDPMAVAALAEWGVDLARHKSKRFEELRDHSFDLILALSPEALARAEDFTRTLHCAVESWPLPDPTETEGTAARRLDAFRDLRDRLDMLIQTRFGG